MLKLSWNTFKDSVRTAQ